MVQAAIRVTDGVQAPGLPGGAEIVDGQQGVFVQSFRVPSMTYVTPSIVVKKILPLTAVGLPNMHQHQPSRLERGSPAASMPRALRVEDAWCVTPDEFIRLSGFAHHLHGQFQVLHLVGLDVDAPDAVRPAGMVGRVREAQKVVPVAHDDVGEPAGKHCAGGLHFA